MLKSCVSEVSTVSAWKKMVTVNYQSTVSKCHGNGKACKIMASLSKRNPRKQSSSRLADQDTVVSHSFIFPTLIIFNLYFIFLHFILFPQACFSFSPVIPRRITLRRLFYFFSPRFVCSDESLCFLPLAKSLLREHKLYFRSTAATRVRFTFFGSGRRVRNIPSQDCITQHRLRRTNQSLGKQRFKKNRKEEKNERRYTMGKTIKSERHESWT